MSKQDISKKTAFKFVILLSVVSLFADMTYEGARSITEPYLAILIFARWLYPHPQALEIERDTLEAKGMNSTF